MTSRWYAGVAGTFLWTVVAVTGTGCSSTGDERSAAMSSDAAVRVRTETVTFSDLPAMLEANGSVAPWARVSPGTKILGRVEEVRVREGDRVRKGDLLARLEARDLDAAVSQAEAAVAMAEAELVKAQTQYRRITELHGRGSVTDKRLEDSIAGFKVAEAAVSQAHANVAAAVVNREYAEIVAPRSGWITRKNIEAGDMATPGSPMFVIEDLSPVRIIAMIPESDVSRLEAGTVGEVRVDALHLTVQTTIDRLIPSGDSGSRTYEAHLRLDNADGRLKSGMFARVSFSQGSRSALTIESDALVSRGQLTGLFVVEERRARLRWVQVGRPVGDRVEILAGLAEGERYVTGPTAGLFDGSAVESD